MRFITDHIVLQPPKIGTAASYRHRIESVCVINKQTQKQTVCRDISIAVQSKTAQGWEFRCVINNAKLELPSILRKQETLSAKIADVLNVICLEIDTSGTISKLLNHDEVINKWNTIKPILQREYIGQGATSYLKGIEKKITDHDALLRDLKEYRMLGCLFNGLYREHSSMETNSGKREKKIGNLVMNVAVPIQENMMLSIDKEDLAVIAINGNYEKTDELEGNIKKALLKKNVYESTPFQVKTYKGIWEVDKGTMTVSKASLLIDSHCGEQYQKRITYSMTRD